MAKIISPNPQYNGVSASVKFVNGEGETDDENLITWFLENGYSVEKEMTVAEGEESSEIVADDSTAEIEAAEETAVEAEKPIVEETPSPKAKKSK